ncbi:MULTISPECIES: LytR/AlgR family response regulator transcription factor [Mesoflavibacter]|uniref:LytR/AlgR family response regulator transcription factor n=1 Tax=Mesoflavibacter TaxID=444051 RepID=UPI000D106B92|nr:MULTISPECIES: response regulator [Mesoflavibacter]QIJ88690.1 Sensory transduction regulatory protein [Mesoflavibacter sp. HG96]QIJ91418.1 Sensory transduction regulatory protein [Mesoflavibacter sp. HG37]
MSQVKILVVEDEILIADNICDTLEDLGYYTFEPAINYTEAITILKTEKPDIALLDINLSGAKSGIDIAKEINEKYQIPFVFLTSNTDKDTVGLAKQVQPQAYLVKPFTQEELFTSIEIAISNFNKKDSPSIKNKAENKGSLFVKEKGMFIKLNFEDILYIKSDHVYVEIILYNAKKHVIRISLNDIIHKLPDNFIRVHRGYIVNYNHLEKIQTNMLVINGLEIPLGKKYKENLLQKINIA